MTNEEKYKTPEERNEAFGEFCESRECNKCEFSKYGENDISLCKFRWLTLEAEEGKPLPCPFCGGEAIGVHERYGFSEHCKLCWAGTDVYNTKADAIAAWNRRVK